MNEHDVADAVESLINRFPPRHLNPNDPNATVRYVREYLEDLDDLPPALVVGAIKQLRRTSTFMPSVGEIRGLIASAVTPRDTTIGEATQLIQKQINANGARFDAVTFDDPCVMDAVKTVGWDRIRLEDRSRGDYVTRDLEVALKAAQERQRRGVQDGTAAIGAGNVTAIDRRAS